MYETFGIGFGLGLFIMVVSMFVRAGFLAVRTTVERS